MGFSRQEYWSGLPCIPPGDLPSLGIKPTSPLLQVYQRPIPRPFSLNFLLRVNGENEQKKENVQPNISYSKKYVSFLFAVNINHSNIFYEEERQLFLLWKSLKVTPNFQL